MSAAREKFNRQVSFGSNGSRISRRSAGWPNIMPLGCKVTSSPGSRWRLMPSRFLSPTPNLRALPPQVGIYGYLLGGLGYALLGSSRQLASGPTSAISLMIAGTVGAMANGDAVRYAQIASLAGFTVALLCLIAWLLRLSTLVKLISDSILVGFKAGAGLTIATTQLPSLFGVPGGGHNFLERLWLLAGQLGQINYLVLALGVVAIAMLLFGERSAARKAGRTWRRRFINHRVIRSGASRSWGSNDRAHPGGPSKFGGPGAAHTGHRRDCSARRRMPAPRLH